MQNNSALRHPPGNVLITDKLHQRPPRTADVMRENEALRELARHLAQSPATILQALVEKTMELCQAESAGISISETHEGEEIFRWHAVAGRLKPFLKGTMPRHFSPCGVVLDKNSVQLMTSLKDHWAYVEELGMPFHEVLLVPFHQNDKPIGTIWVVSHSGHRSFDAEDSRVLHSLIDFTASAVEIYHRLSAKEK